jgi:hypothetical protein
MSPSSHQHAWMSLFGYTGALRVACIIQHQPKGSRCSSLLGAGCQAGSVGLVCVTCVLLLQKLFVLALFPLHIVSLSLLPALQCYCYVCDKPADQCQSWGTGGSHVNVQPTAVYTPHLCSVG